MNKSLIAFCAPEDLPPKKIRYLFSSKIVHDNFPVAEVKLHIKATFSSANTSHLPRKHHWRKVRISSFIYYFFFVWWIQNRPQLVQHISHPTKNYRRSARGTLQQKEIWLGAVHILCQSWQNGKKTKRQIDKKTKRQKTILLCLFNPWSLKMSNLIKAEPKIAHFPRQESGDSSGWREG